jgi:hypothetical protein
VSWIDRVGTRLPIVPASLALCVTLSGSARPEPVDPASELSVRLVCPPRPAPGRVVCEAELEVDTGLLAWADVLVIEAPPFALPLRSRVGPSALFMKSEQRQRLQLALAATSTGSGMLRVRARAVRCTDREMLACRSAAREAEARVVVGPITE